MIRAVEGMPPGTVGFEAAGKVSEEDYCTTLVQASPSGPEQCGPARLSASRKAAHQCDVPSRPLSADVSSACTAL